MYAFKMIALGGLALFFAGHAASQTARDPLVRAEGIQKLSSHVWEIPDEDVPAVSNIGIVVGSRAALVIDTGLGERNGAIVYRAAQAAAPDRMLYLVTTHVHPEHDLGAQAFPPSVKFIRSRDQAREIEESGLTVADRFRERTPFMAELLKGATFRQADILFDREYDLDLGGVKVTLYAMGANHTLGDTAIFVEPDRVLFGGDIAMQRPPIMGSPHSTLSHWLESLDRFDALRPALTVPSHGPTGKGSALTDRTRAFLRAVRDRSLALKAEGRTADQAAGIIAAELQSTYSDNEASLAVPVDLKTRVAPAVKSVYAEGRQ
jgi:glyoxylase-like metal-dependent hydrolase (beta-lactamase superfamily II)